MQTEGFPNECCVRQHVACEVIDRSANCMADIALTPTVPPVVVHLIAGSQMEMWPCCC